MVYSKKAKTNEDKETILMKNTRLKKVTALLLIFLLTFAAFGCGNKDNADQPQDVDGTSVSDGNGEGADGEDGTGDEDVKEGSYDEKVNEQIKNQHTALRVMPAALLLAGGWSDAVCPEPIACRL